MTSALPPRWFRGLAALAAAALLLAGCTGGSGATDSAGGQAEAAAGDAPADGSAARRPAAGTANRAAVQTRAVIRTGTVSLVSRDIGRARAAIEDLVLRHGGFIAQEESSNDGRGRLEHMLLVLRLPAPDFDTAMRELAGLARLRHSHREAEDVTTEMIDVTARVSVQEAALARLERFLRQAQDVDDMIRLESEIATRQAALESLKAQQEYLADQTALATITVELSARPELLQTTDQDTGFLAGFTSGWRALEAVLVTAATVAGALLPFIAAFALVAVPVWLLVRALARRRADTTGVNGADATGEG